MKGGNSQARPSFLLAERNRRGFEVRSSRFPKHRTPNFELPIAPFSHISRFTRRGPWMRTVKDSLATPPERGREKRCTSQCTTWRFSNLRFSWGRIC